MSIDRTPLVRRRLAPAALATATAVAIAVLTACGGDGPSPPASRGSAPTVKVIAGGGSDTIGAVLATPLTVEVRDSAGRPVPGTSVHFVADTTSGPRVHFSSVPLPPLTDREKTDASTDAGGRVAVFLVLGDVAGTARFEIRVPALGLVAPDSVIVARGARARISAPVDTGVFVGETVQLRAVVADRGGNAFPDALTFASSDAAFSVTAGGSVSGRAVGVGTVTAWSGRFSAPIRVAVVPRGTLAVRVKGGTIDVAVMGLDQAGYRVVAPSLSKPLRSGNAAPLVMPRWHPDGDRIVFTSGYDNATAAGNVGDSARVVESDLSGRTRVLVSPQVSPFTTDPVFSRDGAWLYFAGVVRQTGQYRLWRARADGSGAELIDPGTANEFATERRPDPSPDGSRLVYSYVEGFANPTLWVRDLRTGARTPLYVSGTSPRWSPAGDAIGYVDVQIFDGYSGRLHVVRPDGSGDRRLGTGAFRPAFDWSPDGRYIIAEIMVDTIQGTPGGLVLIDVTTGVQMQITSRIQLGEPSWRPDAR